MELNKEYWNNRYLENNTPWDIGDISNPIKAYIDSLDNANLKILIPGAGRAYEAIYLKEKGFGNVFVCDWAEKALELILRKYSGYPKDHLLVTDFFDLEDKFDLIIEQTFFCALPPSMRPDYVAKSNELLKTNGLLVGLFFANNFERPGPPFGGSHEEYKSLFSQQFEILEMGMEQNSILPRLGNELFFRMKKT